MMVSKRRKWFRRVTAVCAAGVASSVFVVGAGSSAGAVTLPSPVTPLSNAQAGALAVKVLGPLRPVKGSTTRGVSGKTITLSGLVTETQNGEPTLQGMCAGAEARLARANRQGGVRGYKINYLGCTDDGSSAQTAHQTIQKAVLQQRVFAMVPMGSVVTTLSDGAFLNQNHVPYFGSGISAAYCGWNSAAFAFSSMEAVGCPASSGHQFTSSFALAIYNAYKKPKNPASVKWAIVGTDNPAEVALQKALGSIAKTLGNKVVYNQEPDPGPGQPPLTNWAPVANQVISSGATIVFNSIAGADALSMVQALAAQGYKGDIQSVGLNSPLLLSIPSLAAQVNGTLAEVPWVGASSYPSKQLTQVEADLTAIKSTLSVDSFPVLWGYQSADFFLEAVAKTKGPLTTEKVANIINAGFTYTGYGTATGPSLWPQGHVTQSNFAGLAKIDGPGKTTKALIPIGQYGANYLIPTS